VHAKRRIAIGLALVIILVVAAAAGGSLFVGNRYLAAGCTLKSLRPISLGQNSFLFAKDGSLLGAVPSTRNRQPLKLGQISPWLAKGTVAIEDRRFYRHGGLDYQGIARAAWSDLRAGRIVEGGSTITQELVRNLYIGNNQRTISRKLKEACLANKLADVWTKNQILAAYLNEVFYGQRAYGAAAAAQTFFSRPADRLTLPQAALLAGLPQSPTTYDPFRNPRAARQRRNDVLRAMLQAGFITPRRFRHAMRVGLQLKPGSLYSTIRHPNFFGWAETQLIARFGSKAVEAGGLKVRTTIIPQWQFQAQQAMASVLREKTDPAAALVSIDPSTGAVRAMVNYLPSGRKLKFNIATQGGRQAGSSFKPFTLATALNEGISLQSTFSGPPSLSIPDPQCAFNGEPWDVHNYADETAGTMNLLEATAHSVNTIFAQLVVKAVPSKVAITAHRMGIRSTLQPVCSITLGTQAVNPLEMTDAYATFASRGIHHAPQAFQIVRSPKGDILGKLESSGERALPETTADQATYALQGVVTHGTGVGASLGYRPVAGKTGTAENSVDAWFCGYTPQLATCVWVGYPYKEVPMSYVEGVAGVTGGSLPAEIWHKFMSFATENMPVKYFPQPTFTGHSVGGQYYSTPSTHSYTPSYTPRYTTPPPPKAQEPPPPPVIQTVPNDG
jgi:penicillin-binding protein 1A